MILLLSYCCHVVVASQLKSKVVPRQQPFEVHHKQPLYVCNTYNALVGPILHKHNKTTEKAQVLLHTLRHLFAHHLFIAARALNSSVVSLFKSTIFKVFLPVPLISERTFAISAFIFSALSCICSNRNCCSNAFLSISCFCFTEWTNCLVILVSAS